MILDYSISTLNTLKELPNLKTAQITLNGRQFPSKRRTVEMLKKFEDYDTDIIIHYDFIYIVSRFVMFSHSVQSAILNEVADILNYAGTRNNIIGIVMHTDFPIRSKFISKGKIKDSVYEAYTGTLWDTESVKEISTDINGVLSKSLDLFYEMLKPLLNTNSKKVYLENSTSVCDETSSGTLQFLSSYIKNDKQDVYGLCIDTEHHYAVTGDYISVDEILSINKDIDVIVHLNTIPEEVKPKSKRDRHSKTTIFDCSLNSHEFYQDFADSLRENGINFCREVKEDTMFEEMNAQQLK